MLIEETCLSYWIQWLCPKCNWNYIQKPKMEVVATKYQNNEK